MTQIFERLVNRQGDTLPVHNVILKDSASNIEDLTLATSVTFDYQPVDGDIPDASVAVVSRVCTINVPLTDGSVTFTPIAGDTVAAGTFFGVFKVTFPTGIKSFPNGKGAYVLYCVTQGVL